MSKLILLKIATNKSLITYLDILVQVKSIKARGKDVPHLGHLHLKGTIQ